ncbi:MAG: CPBP family intramembrane metalloprotease [Sedimentisphaerales bacterium]|nr:CPBP family intramembrane metalloprotease [Sedimentisphaerales bacterium]
MTRSKPPAKNTIATLPGRYLNTAPGSYLETTSRPLYALLFLLPAVVIYEVGTLLVNTAQVEQTLVQKRVVTFIWLIRLARWTGMRDYLVWAFPGLVVVILLLCWHLASRHEWNVKVTRLGWMLVESTVLCVPLLMFNAALGGSSRVATTAAATGAAGATGSAGAADQALSGSYLAHLVTSIGAGIYEELIFRLILIGLLVMLLEDVFKIKPAIAVIVAVLLSSALFAAHHYVGIDAGQILLLPEPFTLVGFTFRTIAGIYFALVFSWRGFGITAGTHAAYDIILRTLWP